MTSFIFAGIDNQTFYVHFFGVVTLTDYTCNCKSVRYRIGVFSRAFMFSFGGERYGQRYVNIHIKRTFAVLQC